MTKRVLITGSSKGIGRATATYFAAHGHRVAVNGRDETALRRTTIELRDAGTPVIPILGDITDAETAERIIAEATTELGGLDILINNAGTAMRGSFRDTTSDVWQRVLATNVVGSANMTRAALPHVIASGGSIVFISSLVALWGFPAVSAYSAAKMALNGLVESLRTEISGSGVHLGIVYVGITQNDADKAILAADGSPLPLAARPSAMRQEQVAREVYRLTERRRRQAILTGAGKALSVVARFAPWILRIGMRFSAKRIQRLSE